VALKRLDKCPSQIVQPNLAINDIRESPRGLGVYGIELLLALCAPDGDINRLKWQQK
jgi:hypothetical protein